MKVNVSTVQKVTFETDVLKIISVKHKKQKYIRFKFDPIVALVTTSRGQHCVV